MNYYIGQALGLLSTVCTIILPFFRKKWQILTLNICVNLLLTLNFLLIGQDENIDEVRQRSDVMILATVNPETADLTLTSLQRDMFVPIPGHGEQRLNAAFHLGGMQLLGETLKANFDLTVDGMVAVDFDGFGQIVDMLGGVNITLTEAEAAR